MGNFNSTLTQIHFVLDTTSEESIKKGLYNIFRHDCDFTENEEYFRDDTLSLGYNDEAERIIVDYVNHYRKKYTLKKEDDIKNLINQLCLEIFGDDSYYQDWEHDVIKLDNTKFSVAICYTN